MNVLPRRFYARDSLEVAPELLNKVFWHRTPAGVVAGRIVEVEAYTGSLDEASHAFAGKTRRTEVMFGPAGHLYVYFTYGMHFCANVVCGANGEGTAVLIRALAPLRGLELMREARGKVKGGRERLESDLCSGPAKLCQALGITGVHNGVDVVRGKHRIRLKDDGTAPPHEPGQGPRIGIKKAVELPWRWWVRGDPNVSR